MARSKEFFYVDELFKKLNVYKENLSACEVVTILGNGTLKYLTDKVPPTDMAVKEYFNLGCKTIHMGEFQGFTVTDICNLATHISRFLEVNDNSEIAQVGEYFTQLKKWELNLTTETVEVVVDFTSEPDGAITFLSVSKFPEIAERILQSIVKVDKSLLQGGAIALLNFIFKTGIPKPIGADLTLKIAKALTSIQFKYPKFEYYCVGRSDALSAYTWAFTTYTIADYAFSLYVNKARQQGLSELFSNSNVAESLKLQRESVKEALIEKLNIKVGDVVLFSLAPFSQACPFIDIYSAMLGIDPTGAIVEGEDQMRQLNFNSLFLAKVENYNNDYLVLKIKYEQMNFTNTLTIPIRWDLLLPDLSKGLPDVKQTEQSKRSNLGFNKYKRKNKTQEFFSILNTIPILLTNANCSSLGNPNFPIMFSKF